MYISSNPDIKNMIELPKRPQPFAVPSFILAKTINSAGRQVTAVTTECNAPPFANPIFGVIPYKFSKFSTGRRKSNKIGKNKQTS